MQSSKHKQTTNPQLPVVIVLLLVVTIAAYLPVLHADFVNFDDEAYVTANPHVQSGLTAEAFKWAFNVGYQFNWHPLTWISHMLDCQFFGAGPAGPHAVNLLLHLANTLLLFFVLNRMTKSLWKSAFVAALFAVHPMHVESVAWVAERKDVLSTLFWMLTMWAYVRYTEVANLKRYAVVVLFFALGLMSKPTLVTLPIVLLLLDYWPLGRWSCAAWRLVREKLPLFALSAASCVITFLAQQRGEAVRTFTETPLASRIGNALTAYVSYIAKMLWPAKLAVFYPYPAGVSAWHVVGAILILACITVLVLRFARSRPYLVMGWLWYLVVLVPMIGLVQVGGQAMADRYTYMPFIGLFIMLAWGSMGRRTSNIELRTPNIEPEGKMQPPMKVRQTSGGVGVSDRVGVREYGSTGAEKVQKQSKKRKHQGELQSPAHAKLSLHPLAAVSLAVVMTLVVCTWRQTGYWSDSVALWTHTLAVTTGNDVAHNNLGMEYGRLGRSAEEVEEYQAAIRINPDFGMAYVNLGASCISLRRYAEAENAFRQAIRINPDYAKAHFGLGLTHIIKGKKALALDEYKILTKLDMEKAKKLLRFIDA